jgi:hypothetical protein
MDGVITMNVLILKNQITEHTSKLAGLVIDIVLYKAQ